MDRKRNFRALASSLKELADHGVPVDLSVANPDAEENSFSPAKRPTSVLRRGLEFRIIFMDVATPELWFKRGWQIDAHSFATHGEAHAEMERWKLTLGKKRRSQSAPSRQPSL